MHPLSLLALLTLTLLASSATVDLFEDKNC